MLINIIAAYSKYKSTAKTCLHGCSHHISYAQKRKWQPAMQYLVEYLDICNFWHTHPLKQNKPTYSFKKAGLIILIP